MYAIEPRYNEFFDITNIIWKHKRKIYIDITNYNVNTQEKINAEQINSQQILFFMVERASLSVNSLLYMHVADIGTIVFPQKSPVLQINH